MKTKNFQIIFIFAVAFVFFPFLKASAKNVNISLSEPTKLTNYYQGEIVKINFSSDFKPKLKNSISVNIIYQNFKKIRVSSFTKKTSDGNYSVQWKVPENFFITRNIKSESTDLKIEILNGNGIRNRYISGRLIKLMRSKNADKPAPDNSKPDIQNVIIPNDSKKASHYEFSARLEPFVVSKLTVVNDSQNDGFDNDSAESSNAVSQAYIAYKDVNDNMKVRSAEFVNDAAVFGGIDFYIPKNGNASLDVWVKPNSASDVGSSVSGKIYRIGIQDTGNSQFSFQATGQISSVVINNPAGLSMSGTMIETFIVKSATPTFIVLSPADQVLLNGQNDVYKFKITAASASLGRIVFNVSQTGLTSLDQVQIYRNGRLLTAGDSSNNGEVYLMWDSGSSSCFASTVQSGVGTGMNCSGDVSPSSKLILIFSNEELISGSNDYTINFNVSGVQQSSAVTVSVSHDDDFAKSSFSGSDSVNAKIYNGGSAPELFSSPTDFASEATSISDRNIIWSDRSADFHAYPSISPASLPTADTGSSVDWSNGYLLYLNSMPAVTTSR